MSYFNVFPAKQLNLCLVDIVNVSNQFIQWPLRYILSVYKSLFFLIKSQKFKKKKGNKFLNSSKPLLFITIIFFIYIGSLFRCFMWRSSEIFVIFQHLCWMNKTKMMKYVLIWLIQPENKTMKSPPSKIYNVTDFSQINFQPDL